MEQNIIDELRNIQITPRGNLINGKISTSLSGETIDVVSPIDGNHMTMIPRSRREDVDLAVNSARDAFNGQWGKISGKDRAKYIYRIARIIQEKSKELAIVETLDGGKPIRESRDIDIPLAANHFFYYAKFHISF